MGRIIAQVRITNPLDPAGKIDCAALVDAGEGPIKLPSAWRERLGKLGSSRQRDFEVAAQRTVAGAVCGPVEIQIEAFQPVFNAVVFLDMQPQDGQYEPLLGYLILEQSLVAVDRVGHRLVPIKHGDLK